MQKLESLKKLYNITSETINLILKTIILNGVKYYDMDLLLFNELIYKSMILNKIKDDLKFNIDIFNHQFIKNFHIILKIMNNNNITYINLNYNDYKPYFIIDLFTWNNDIKYFICVKYNEIIVYNEEINLFINNNDIDYIKSNLLKYYNGFRYDCNSIKNKLNNDIYDIHIYDPLSMSDLEL
jgi:hypothetical protein